MSVSDSQFIGNTTTDHGGAIYFEGSSLSVSRTTMAVNGADRGGGLYIDQVGADARVDTSLLVGNNAEDSGGGVGVGGFGTALEVANSTVSGNVATVHGGGIEVRQHTELSLSNVTITDNDADPDIKRCRVL